MRVSESVDVTRWLRAKLVAWLRSNADKIRPPYVYPPGTIGAEEHRLAALLVQLAEDIDPRVESQD